MTTHDRNQRWIRMACMTALVVTVSCKAGRTTVFPGGSDATASDLTAIKIGLPDRGDLKDKVPDIEAKMNGYRLQVTATETLCEDPTQVDEVEAWGSDALVDAKLTQGCSYAVSLFLGQLSESQDAGELAAVYFANEDPLEIDKDEIEGQSSIRRAITLSLQEAGRNIGLGTEEVTGEEEETEEGGGTTGGSSDGPEFDDFSAATNTKYSFDLQGLPDWRVFQRTGDEGVIPIRFANPGDDVSYARARVLAENEDTVVNGWKTFSVESGSGSLNWDMPADAGGWYRVEVILYDENGAILGRDVAEKVGVGEVFVVAGQSNSTNCHSTPIQSQSGLVASTDGERWQVGNDPQIGAHDFNVCEGGSSWPTAGDEIANELDVPVAFASTGYSGTSIADWQPGGSNRRLYSYTLDRIQQLGENGFRAVLWHQGEDDVKDETSGDVYYDSLKNIIDKSRNDAGWDFPWLVAEAAWCRQIQAYNKPNQEPVITGAQSRLADQLSYVYSGPNTDQFGFQYRGTNCHFNAQGSRATGRAWADKILQFLQ